LDAVDFGVPQERRRAVLVARRDGVPARLPAPTHVEPVTMAAALDWGPGYVGFPRRAVGARAIVLGGVAFRARDLRSTALPSFTITGKA
ncbi:hypothetical protein, partial [Salmonella enterica]|uniref:hypothetical protein n=1 Tax=Salmonella enterica TaxID=28901 RepID=UPI003D766EAA